MEETASLIRRYEGSLRGQVALVSGGGSGIGRAIAVAFAVAGADVAVLGRRPEALDGTAELVRAAGARALPLPADVRDPDALLGAVSSAAAELGPADIAVAAAGVNAWAPIQELAPDVLREALATNVEGVANLMRAVLPAMRDRRAGRIIVVASDNGRRPEAEGGGYVASKFGAVGLALSVAQELHADGIAISVIEPGCVDTDWYPPEEDAPRDRMLRTEDVALLALFLATLPSRIVLEELLAVPRELLVRPWA